MPSRRHDRSTGTWERRLANVCLGWTEGEAADAYSICVDDDDCSRVEVLDDCGQVGFQEHR
jgi:hypothetical protein